MLIEGIYDTDIVQPPRNEKLLKIVKPIVNWISYFNSDLHVNMPPETLKFLMETYNAMIISTHKGLPETVLSPVAFYRLGLRVPYSVIGDNLIKGKGAVSISKEIGMVFSERTNSDIEGAVINSRSKMASVLEAGNLIALYPTPGRSKNGLTMSFQSSPFQLAILLDIPIIPHSPGYFRYPEEHHFVERVGRTRSRQKKKKGGYTVKWYDMPELVFGNKGDVYLNYGKPIIPSEYFGTKIPPSKIVECSKEFADHVRKECLYLTPITERHIVAYAMEQPGYIRDNVAMTLEKIEPHSNKFTFKFPGDCKFGDISLDDKVDILIHNADLQGKHQKLVLMYGNEIKHYVEGMYGRKFD